MSLNSKVKVVVKSRRVPVGTVDISLPSFSPSGVFIGMQTRRAVLYDRSLDTEHQKAIEEGRRLSDSLGGHLEVVDASKSGLFGRVLASLGRRELDRPAIVVAPFMSQAEGSVACESGPTR
jgi:hypothetical protein